MIVGYGAVGSVLAKILIREKSITKVFCLSLNFFEKIKNEKIEYKISDIMKKEEFVDYINKIKPNIVINTSLPKFNTLILECCTKAKVNYMDAASFWDLDKDKNAKSPYKIEQLDFNKKFLDNNTFGLINAGVAPGLDNILAAECASYLDETDYIKIRMVEDTGSKEIFFSWNKDWLLDELNCKPLVYENGKFKLVENFGGEEEFDFPQPIGKRKTYYFAQDEVGSIPLYIKTKKLDVKIHDNNIDVSKLLVKLGLTSYKSIKIDGVDIKPIKVLSKILPDSIPGEEKKYPNSIFALAVEATGKKDGKKKAIKYSVVFPKQEEIGKMDLGANFISYPTAISMALFILVIPMINKRGVLPTECLEKDIREVILKSLPKNKIKVYKKIFTPKS
jgi:saccharopine dehydrogenase-like NADP-dependent oxidoreductase